MKSAKVRKSGSSEVKASTLLNFRASGLYSPFLRLLIFYHGFYKLLLIAVPLKPFHIMNFSVPY